MCIIDAVYSIGANYSSTQNTVLRYCQKYDLKPYRDYGSSPIGIKNEHTIFDFLQLADGKSYESLASSIFGNRQRTSTRNGMLKAQAVYEFANVLNDNGINAFTDIPKLYNSPKIETQIRAIKGQGKGLSLNYFYMLTGNDDYIKADRHILRFIEEATGQLVTKQQAETMLTDCVRMLRKNNPHITCRLLDHAIWSYMSTR